MRLRSSLGARAAVSAVVALLGCSSSLAGSPGIGAPPLAAPPPPSRVVLPEKQDAVLDRIYPVRSGHLVQAPASTPVGHIHGLPLQPPPPADRSGPVTYSAHHLLGYRIGSTPYAVWINAPGGAPDDIVTFDGVEEAIRRDITGTDPRVNESRTDLNPWLTTLTISTRSNDGTDLFPGGYVYAGRPLTDGVFAVGYQQPLLWPTATRVRAATIQFFRDGLEFSPVIPLDPAIFFPSNPWNGVTGITFINLAGQGVDAVQLSITLDVAAPGDFDGDIDVDASDRDTFFNNMVRPTRTIAGDFDLNGEVNMRDFQTMQNVCTTGSCSDIYIDEDDSPIVPWINNNSNYINFVNNLVGLLASEIIQILEDTGQVARIEIVTQRIQQISVQVLYFKQIERSVAVIDFMDGRPSMKIIYEQAEEFIEVWYTHYESRVVLFRPAGTQLAASLQQFRTCIKAIDNIGKGVGIASALITASQPCLLEQAIRDLGEMFAEQHFGFCLPPCLSFTGYFGQLSGWCFGRLEGTYQLLLYYSCFWWCDVIETYMTPASRFQVRTACFNIANAIRSRYGC